MPSIQKLYAYCVWAASVAFGLLAWNFVSITSNLTEGRIGKQTAVAAGIKPDPVVQLSALAPTDTYSGYVINNINKSFINLSGGLLVALTWVLLFAFIGMSARAILSKDLKLVLIPGAIFFFSNIILGVGVFDIGENVFTTNMMASVSVITGIGVVGALLNERYNVAKAWSSPDYAPEASERRAPVHPGGKS